MVREAGSEGIADYHNECIDNISALFEEYDPLEDEINELEQKLAALKGRQEQNAKNKP